MKNLLVSKCKKKHSCHYINTALLVQAIKDAVIIQDRDYIKGYIRGQSYTCGSDKISIAGQGF